MEANEELFTDPMNPEEIIPVVDREDVDSDDAIRLYLKEIGDIRVLGADNEFRLALCIQAGRYISGFEGMSESRILNEITEKLKNEKSAFDKKLKRYNLKAGKQLPAPDEALLIREAVSKSPEARSDDSSALYSYMTLAETGQGTPWTETCAHLFNAFLCLYILPPEIISGCETFSEAIDAVTRFSESGNDALKPLLQTQFKKIHAAAGKAEQAFICANLKLVYSIAKRYRDRGTAMQDLIQEGNLGLLHAVEKYDPRLGYRFSTYATWWIRQSITRSLASQSRLIRMPAHTFESLMKVLRVRRDLEQQLGRTPTPEELAVESGSVSESDAAAWLDARKTGQQLPKAVVNRIRDAGWKLMEQIKQLDDPVSLETPETDDGEDSQTDYFPEDESAVRPTEEADRIFLKDQIREVMSELSERERQILIYRFGLEDGEERTLEEISRDLGITKERVRQIEVSALRKLRHPTVSAQLKDYFE